MFKYITRIFLIGFLLINFCGCSKNSDSNVYTVQAQTISHTLTYKGTIAPLELINVQSPADGVVQNVYFQPGQLIKKDQLLLSIYSPKYITDYQNAMLAYLKAKEDYSNAQTSFLGTQELWNHGLIARNDYNTAKSALANSYAMLLQQQQAVIKFLPPSEKIDASLNLEDKASLNKLFTTDNNNVNIYAPTTGIVLGPAKSSNSSGSSNDNSAALRLSTGNQMHQGDSLLTIGNLSGFNLIVSISEMDIDNIKMNMKATISSDAFPEIMHGYVAEVGIQAKNTGNDVTLPEFPVRVVVPSVPADYLKDIKIGMTAKVNIELGSNQQLLIPITAVGNQNGQSVVKKLGKYGHAEITPITTGDTTVDQVTVLSGLKSGDRILVTY